ncbi:FAST kinase domain-containing protein 1, mitochondrial isoform X2 [Anthonomus grandis grandis]|uniref:FAST kinase domain-containing protein 1, mitochondrial isoform X2 n=1 Tax=Anthonomus grandis grandis TaxID=2921223 RepID=UPI002166BE4F|nr:FAST kinase domain-containing protein 1, mitochondrial isoform X2 [Anthonomus grandis grandis]
MMNFRISLLNKYPIYQYLQNGVCNQCRRQYNTRTFTNILANQPRKYSFTKEVPLIAYKYCSYNNFNITEVEEVTGLYPYSEAPSLSQVDSARSILFETKTDPLIGEISKCVSIEDIFTFLREHSDKLQYYHLTQIVLVLYDLQNIFVSHCSEDTDTDLKESFFKNLMQHQEFYMLTNEIEKSLDTFNPLFLSYMLFYLNRLGFSVESMLIQKMAFKLKNQLMENFSLDNVTRLIRVVFLENSVRPYYIVMDLIPKIFDQIEQLNTAKDLEHLTSCLYRLHNILTDDILKQYDLKIKQLIQEKILTEKDYQLILKTLLVFNTSKWRHKYCSTLSSSISFIKNSMELLNFTQMYHVYDIFFKIQEPGDALNYIQRAAAKLLNELEDTESNYKDKMKLFSLIIYFSSPINKQHFREDIDKYSNKNENLSTLITRRKILSYLKISDPKICDAYWNKVCQVLGKEHEFDKIIRLMDNYMYFCIDIPGFRHYAFEHHILKLIRDQHESGLLTMYPYRFFTALPLALIGAQESRFLESLLDSFQQLKTQMTIIDILKISQSIQISGQRKSILTTAMLQELKSILHKQSEITFSRTNTSEPFSTGILAKSCIIRNDCDNELFDDMVISFKHTKYMSSKCMEYMCYIMYTTASLVPEVVNLCIEYLVHNKRSIVGFNAYKLLLLCFELNYLPVLEDVFFKSVIDIMLRDQERMSCLALLQSALSLCYFHKIPKSLIKQIFNVEFLDRVDVELKHCYYRDRYPHRVRRHLMQLNRAVCLEYPEYNVPWFHQKYIEDYQKINARDDLVTPLNKSVKSYLRGILGKHTVLENVTVPYGYEVDFVVHLDQNQNPTDQFDHPSTTLQFF